MIKKLRKGQSTMEYVLLFAGLTLVAIYAVNKIVTKTEAQADKAGDIITNSTTTLGNAVGI